MVGNNNDDEKPKFREETGGKAHPSFLVPGTGFQKSTMHVSVHIWIYFRAHTGEE